MLINVYKSINKAGNYCIILHYKGCGVYSRAAFIRGKTVIPKGKKGKVFPKSYAILYSSEVKGCDQGT